MRKPSVEIRDERLVGRRVVRGAGEADPHVELGRAHELGVAEVDVVDDADLPRPLAADVAGDVVGARRRAARVGVTNDVVLDRAQEDQRAGADLVALADGHRAARHRASGVHALDGDLEGRLVRRATGEHGVDGLDGLPVLAGQPRHDRLGQQLAAEDDTVRRRQVGGAVAVAADRLEREGLEEGINGRHRDSFSSAGRACASAPRLRRPTLPDPPSRRGGPPSAFRPVRRREAATLGRDWSSVNFDDDVKVRYPPERGSRRCACAPGCDAVAPGRCQADESTTRGRVHVAEAVKVNPETEDAHRRQAGRGRLGQDLRQRQSGDRGGHRARWPTPRRRRCTGRSTPPGGPSTRPTGRPTTPSASAASSSCTRRSRPSRRSCASSSSSRSAAPA